MGPAMLMPAIVGSTKVPSTRGSSIAWQSNAWRWFAPGQFWMLPRSTCGPKPCNRRGFQHLCESECPLFSAGRLAGPSLGTKEGSAAGRV